VTKIIAPGATIRCGAVNMNSRGTRNGPKALDAPTLRGRNDGDDETHADAARLSGGHGRAARGNIAPEAWAAPKPKLDITKIFFEFNSSANDLGVHVFLDGEDWKKLKIVNPDKLTIFEVEGKGPYAELGMTELFFEGAEPSLDDVPLQDLLDMFPAGKYKFSGTNVDGDPITGTATLSHAIPAGVPVSHVLNGNSLVISWTAVNGPPPGFPPAQVNVVAYQVIVGSFQVTVPATINPLQVTVPPEFVQSLDAGTHDFEVLAIEASGNQTITEGTFTKP
jgi:hypothetical protein